MKSVLFSICAAAVVTAVYKAVAPVEKFSGQIKLLISCFFILTVISAVSGASGLWDFSDITAIDTSYTDYTVQLKRMTAEETANALKKSIAEKLSEAGMPPEKIYIDVNISDTGSISINEIKLVYEADGYDEYSQQAVRLVRQLTGTRIKVTAELPARAKKERE